MIESGYDRYEDDPLGELQSDALSFLEARSRLIVSLERLPLTELVRLMRCTDDPLAEVALSPYVYERLAMIHFPVEQPTKAFDLMRKWALHGVDDAALDEEIQPAMLRVMHAAAEID